MSAFGGKADIQVSCPTQMIGATFRADGQQGAGRIWEEPMFDLDQFVADCRDALAADKSHKLVREVVCRAVADPSGVLKTLGEPTRGAIGTLYRSDDLTCGR